MIVKTELLLRSVLFVGLLVGPALASAQTITLIDYPGASTIELNGINAAGEIVGSAVVGGKRVGFRYGHGVFTDIVFPNAVRTDAAGINARGEIVGLYQGADLQFHGFVLDAYGNFTTYDYPTATTGTFLFGITARGTMVGEFKIGQAFGVTGYAFLLTTSGEWQELVPPGSTAARANAINDRGEVAGMMVAGGPAIGWLRERSGQYVTFSWPDADVTNPRGISPSGEVVGVHIKSRASRGFLRTPDGQMIDIAIPGATSTRALAINAGGDIVGTCDIAGVRHGFLLQRFDE